MGPRRATQRKNAVGQPRVSGDGPDGGDGGTFTPTAAPRERGWALPAYVAESRGPGSPA